MAPRRRPLLFAAAAATPLHNCPRDFCNELMNIHQGPKVWFSRIPFSMTQRKGVLKIMPQLAETI